MQTTLADQKKEMDDLKMTMVKKIEILASFTAHFLQLVPAQLALEYQLVVSVAKCMSCRMISMRDYTTSSYAAILVPKYCILIPSL